LLKEEGIKMAIDLMKNAYSDEQMRYCLLSQEKAYRDELSRMSDAIKGEKISIAKKLLDVLSDEQISEKTGLSIDEVKKLRL
jgi:hypothetical protein